MDLEIMSSREAAEYLSLSMVTLKLWRRDGFGPPYIQVHKRLVRYRKVDIDQWLKDNLQEAGK